jgi:3' exoribonuclease, RNase T-like
MKYFLDTEFLEAGHLYPIQLVSIGIVSEDDREFYAVSSEFSESRANDWVKANVLPQLGSIRRIALREIAGRVVDFIHGDSSPEIWGYYADYDWVVFCQLFGSMIDLPKGWPMYCRDIKQWCDSLGNPKLPEQASGEHNALNDARWNKRAYEFLAEHARTRRPQEAQGVGG